MEKRYQRRPYKTKLEKKLVLPFIFYFIFSSSICFSSDFIHPLDFKGSATEKQQVIAYIKQNVKRTYTKIGMGNPSTLRMMETQSLNSFKKLTHAKNRPLLNKVIHTYCAIGMCGYTILSMMYNQELQASQQTLQW